MISAPKNVRFFKISAPDKSGAKHQLSNMAHYTIRASNTTCQKCCSLFKSNQCEKRNLVHQQFDVRNRDGAVGTSLGLTLRLDLGLEFGLGLGLGLGLE